MQTPQILSPHSNPVSWKIFREGPALYLTNSSKRHTPSENVMPEVKRLTDTDDYLPLRVQLL
jgi:hypothetical protein